MKKCELNKDGTVSVTEFELLCRHYSEILRPLVLTRNHLRRKIIFPRFWKELSAKRRQNFLNTNLLEIHGASVRCDYSQVSMEYLNLRADVPYKFVEQWKSTQRKKEQIFRGSIELPYEIYDEYRKKEEEEVKRES
jgi:hypothetical protein